MMREIKFRAKSIIKDDWVYGTYAYTGKNNVIFEDGNPITINIDTLSQFTGFKDKENKEIYEGDLIKIPELYETPENTSTKYVFEKVHFEKGAFIIGDYFEIEDWEYIQEECKVEGNIYENIELLKGE